MALRIIGRCAKLLLEGLPRLLGVGAHVCGIALQGIGLNEAEGPGAPVVVERARGQPQQKLSLLLVEDPDEILVVRQVGHERGGLDLLRRGLEHGPGTGEVSLAEVGHGLVLDQSEVGGREGETTVEGFPRLGIAPQTEERVAESRRMADRPGIEALRLPEVLHRRIPAPEALLGKRRSPEKGGIAGRKAQPLLVLLQGAVVVPRNQPFVVAEGQVPLRAVRRERDGLLRRLPGTLRERGRGRAVGVQERIGPRDSPPTPARSRDPAPRPARRSRAPCAGWRDRRLQLFRISSPFRKAS